MQDTHTYPFRFTGGGAEYFRIWIVNLALTLATLGIYSAWAKVRTERWFYGQTLLDGYAFSYLASPIQILKGRLIAVAALALYFLAEHFLPPLALVLFLLFFLGMPWIVVNALRFRMRQSAYRGLRFDFSGSLGEAFRVYTLWPMALFPTLGLVFPYLAYRQTRFLAEHAHYGNSASSYETGSGPFWKLYFKALGLSLALFGTLAFALSTLGVANLPRPGDAPPGPEARQAIAFAMLLYVALFYLLLPVLVGYLKARTANLLYNGTQFSGPAGGFHFASTQRARDLAWIYLSNLILIAVTLGVFIPWAKVRLAKYRADHLQIVSAVEPEVFSAGQTAGSHAIGSEMADVFDVDVGFS